jgi:2-phosphosulfolactate phosphatase
VSQGHSLRVLITPAGLEDVDLEGRLVIVIDVLRACTTIAHALHAGARGVIPVETVEGASRLAASLGREDTVLGGERGSVRVEGFQLGNSPAEYDPAAVEGRTVVLSTTNGAGALARAAGARECVAAALVTRRAAARRALGFTRTLVVCAGRNGYFAFEDVLCAGLLIEEVLRLRGPDLRLDDGARAALDMSWRRRDDLLRAVRETDHGRALAELGFEEDLRAACALDRFDFVPALRDGRLVAEDSAPDPVPPR